MVNAILAHICSIVNTKSKKCSFIINDICLKQILINHYLFVLLSEAATQKGYHIVISDLEHDAQLLVNSNNLDCVDAQLTMILLWIFYVADLLFLFCSFEQQIQFLYLG